MIDLYRIKKKLIKIIILMDLLKRTKMRKKGNDYKNNDLWRVGVTSMSGFLKFEEERVKSNNNIKAWWRYAILKVYSDYHK